MFSVTVLNMGILSFSIFLLNLGIIHCVILFLKYCSSGISILNYASVHLKIIYEFWTNCFCGSYLWKTLGDNPVQLNSLMIFCYKKLFNYGLINLCNSSLCITVVYNHVMDSASCKQKLNCIICIYTCLHVQWDIYLKFCF